MRHRRTRVEDYLAAIDGLSWESKSHRVKTGAIAEHMQLSKGTVSSVLKELDQQGWIELVPYEGACLSETGRQLARRTLRRSRLLQYFLNHTLHFDWEEASDEAWRLELGASDELIHRIERYLNMPTCTPHGTLIPRADGTLP